MCVGHVHAVRGKGADPNVELDWLVLVATVILFRHIPYLGVAVEKVLAVAVGLAHVGVALGEHGAEEGGGVGGEGGSGGASKGRW